MFSVSLVWAHSMVRCGHGFRTRWSPFTKQLVLIALLIGTVYLLFAPRSSSAAHHRARPGLHDLRPDSLGPAQHGLVAHCGRRPDGVDRVLLVLTVPVTAAPWFMVTQRLREHLTRVITELVARHARADRDHPEPGHQPGSLLPADQPVAAQRGGRGDPSGAISNLPNLLTPFASGLTTVLRLARSAASSGSSSSLSWPSTPWRGSPRAARFVATRVPEMWRPELGRLWRELARIWDAFVLGQLMLGLIVGLVVWILMAILGVLFAQRSWDISALFGCPLHRPGARRHPERRHRARPGLVLAAAL